MKIPWALPYIGEEEVREVTEVVKSTWLTMGPKVAQLEEEVASYLGVRHAVAVNSGTAALDVALKALGVGPGDEVIIPALTYIATANAVLYQGAKPVLADIEPVTFNIDPEEVQKKITSKTKCIMPIDYGGQASNYEALEKIAAKNDVKLIVDGAQSLGGEYWGRKLCSFGLLSTTSFHAAKIITSVEGGMVFTNDEALARRCRIIRNQGEDPKMKYYHVFVGHNYRLSDLHAAVGLAQFRRLNEVINKRTQLADYYTRNLSHLKGKIKLPQVLPGNKHAWFLYPVLINKRDAVAVYLKEQGVDTRVSWPMPIYKQPIYKEILPNDFCPVAEKISQTILNLPMYFTMTREEQDYVIDRLSKAVEKCGGEAIELG